MSKKAKRKQQRKRARRMEAAQARKIAEDEAISALPAAERRALAEQRARQERQAREIQTAHRQGLQSAMARQRKPLQVLEAILDGCSPNVPYSQDEVDGVFRSILSKESYDATRLESLKRLLVMLQRRLPRSLTPNRVLLLWRVTAFAWVRPLEAWKPEGRAEERRFRSLLAHLLARYPVPRFLFSELHDLTEASVLTDETVGYIQNRLRLVSLLGQGSSMKVLQKMGLLPSTLTRRMLHQLSVSRKGRSLVEMVRNAQVRVYGGQPELARAINETFLGRGFLPNEALWASVLQWMSQQPALVRLQIGPMLDYIQQIHRESDAQPGRSSWSIKGRTVSSMIRAMEVWHIALHQRRAQEGHHFRPSGLREQVFQVGVEEHAEVWSFSEILTSADLLAEGRQLRHCVYSYSYRILHGRCSIWSVRLDGLRVLTVEVDANRRKIVQVRGRSNRKAAPKEIHIVRRWARLNQLGWRVVS